MPSCIHDLLEAHAKQAPNAVAIAAPGRISLSYSRLHSHVIDTVSRLNELGLGRNDRIALVLPNGPEMAVTFLAVAAGATAAPLNPAYRHHDFDFYISALHPKAIIVSSRTDLPVLGVARARGIPVIELSFVREQECGLFTLRGEPQICPTHTGFAQPDDVALVLHTSGTTSRPKIVPLSHTNLCASARNIQAVLELSHSDRCLNVMPLFHIHGLVGATLSSLAAGASLVCAPGFSVPEFFAWIDAFQPTWYTAVPTIHQAILAYAALHRCGMRSRLRFIRSCSASLPPSVMLGLQEVFQVPVIESYGMTEASHQITSNPLPPRQRKPGSVGVQAGPEVAIVDEEGQVLPPGETGEVAIRGTNVTYGYANDPIAHQGAYTAGWFRTGDLGFFDVDGYLFIVGRLKEIINRGGEKVSPREVDEALLEHPAVAQAVAFPVPHPTLGEDVAAAVILREHMIATEKDIREFVAARLVHFKVPRRVMIVEEIPQGPTGKVQRIGLGEKLGCPAADSAMPSTNSGFPAHRTYVQEVLAGIWAQVLRLEQVGLHDDFFQAGGDSLSATQVISRLRQTLHVEVPITALFDSSTVAALALTVEEILMRRGEGQPGGTTHVAP
jgi:acyl-CoA synthetase (AMP-forming)/AMP-acid ligase II/acyl carrier protein